MFMNKLILFCISLTFIFASCKHGSSKDVSNISNLVNEAEVIINKYDNNVQSTLDNKKYDQIQVISKVAMDSTNVKIKNLKNLIISSEMEDARTSAIDYINSLQKTINAQEQYMTLTDSTTITAAKELDLNFRESVENAKKIHDIYITKLKTLTK